MAISKGASVIVSRAGIERRGKVIREIAPQAVQGLNPGEAEKTRRYEIELQQHGDLPAATTVFFEHELTAIPRDSRATNP
jgi:hypothetical protein